jgi:peptidoglycan/LPS O-acetylase OafA/YrhL
MASLVPTHLRIDSLFFGVAISYVYHYHREIFFRFGGRYRPALIGLGLLCFIPAFMFDLEKTPFIYTWGFTLVYIGSGLVLAGFVSRELRPNPIVIGLAKIGAHSYSIYLWHMAVEWLFIPWVEDIFLKLGLAWTWSAHVTIYVAACILFGWGLSVLIEYPIMRLRDRIFPTRSRAVFSGIPGGT